MTFLFNLLFSFVIRHCTLTKLCISLKDLSYVDYLLPRTVTAALNHTELKEAFSTGFVPIEVCCAAIIYHSRLENIGTSKVYMLCFCCNWLFEYFHLTSLWHVFVWHIIVFLMSCCKAYRKDGVLNFKNLIILKLCHNSKIINSYLWLVTNTSVFL